MKSRVKLSFLFCFSLVLMILPGNLSTVSGIDRDYSGVRDNDLELIRERVRAYIMRGEVDEARVETILNTITPEGYWPDINYEDVSRTGFQHSEHLANMHDLALAYKKQGNRFTGNSNVKRAVHLALDFWIEHDFICDNWWWNDMGTPLRIINLMMIMDAGLTERQITGGLRIAGRAHMQSAGARPGGDLIRVATIWGKQGLFKRDTGILEEVIEVIASEMQTTTGRGLKPDMSHHHRHDNVISTLTYGMYLPSQYSTWAIFIEGTRFSFPDSATGLLVDFFLDGVCRTMVYGKYPDPGSRNRGISRMGSLNPASPEIVENLYKVSHYRRNELDNISLIRRGEIDPNLRYTSFFWHSEYFIHQRPEWYASVRMYSERNHNMEQPYNGEGLLNHHYADGSNFLTRTAEEYVSIFPVWDWQRVPGTTVVQKPLLPHWNEIARRGRTAFVGAVTDDEYGAAVFDFESVHDPLTARKSWFFFDDEYVCLGSGVSSEAGYPVNTTISQRYVEGDVYVFQYNNQLSLPHGDHSIEGTSMVYHEGVAYIFPSPKEINIKNDESSGYWRRINHSHWATEEVITAGLFILWFDHGLKPQDESYEYIVVPGIELQNAGAYRQNIPVRILGNSTSLQAVKHDGLGISQVVFYESGTVDIGEGITLQADRPCMAMVRESGRRISSITVSDPSRSQETIILSVTGRVRGSVENWNTSWNRSENRTVITVNLPVSEEFAGKSMILDLH